MEYFKRTTIERDMCGSLFVDKRSNNFDLNSREPSFLLGNAYHEHPNMKFLSIIIALNATCTRVLANPVGEGL
jgi:hypothetical protein